MPIEMNSQEKIWKHRDRKTQLTHWALWFFWDSAVCLVLATGFRED